MEDYLTKNDLKTVAPTNFISALTDADEALLSRIVAERVAFAAQYLAPRYSAKALLTARGRNRHPLLLKYMKDLIMYDLLSRQTRQHMSEAAQARYQEALDWFGEVQQGSIALDVADKAPTKPAQAAFSSHARYRNQF